MWEDYRSVSRPQLSNERINYEAGVKERQELHLPAFSKRHITTFSHLHVQSAVILSTSKKNPKPLHNKLEIHQKKRNTGTPVCLSFPHLNDNAKSLLSLPNALAFIPYTTKPPCNLLLFACLFLLHFHIFVSHPFPHSSAIPSPRVPFAHLRFSYSLARIIDLNDISSFLSTLYCVIFLLERVWLQPPLLPAIQLPPQMLIPS